MDKHRIDDSFIPYNVSVDGANDTLGTVIAGGGSQLTEDANMTIQGTLASSATGAFSLSATEKALIDTRTDEINDAGIVEEIPLADIAAIHAADPYQDGDGYIPGPANLSIINPMFIPLLDCNDADTTIYAPFPSLGMTGSCN